MTQDQSAHTWTAARNIRNIFQTATHLLLIGMAVAATVATIAAAFGLLPWLSLNMVSATGETMPVGVWVQSIVTVFLIGLCSFLPGVHQVQRLERSHRDFKVSMDDVARAYYVAHTADRQNAFNLSSEFEDMRDRLTLMRHHPDLSHLEPEILELAAQMSHTTRDLATVYSHDKVTRAKEFLRHRQQELDTLNENISLALSLTHEVRRWQNDVEASEYEANRQMDRLEQDLQEILPHIGFAQNEPTPETKTDGNVVTLSSNTSPFENLAI